MIDTSRSLADSSGPNEGSEASRYYHADPSWFEENNLSFDEVVRARMCDTCRSRVGQEDEERVPVFDQGTGRMRFDVRQTTYGSDPLKCIREHCGRTKNYIHRDMPTLEAIFRIFLANANAADDAGPGPRTTGGMVPGRRLPVAAVALGDGRAPGPTRHALRPAPDRRPGPRHPDDLDPH